MWANAEMYHEINATIPSLCISNLVEEWTSHEPLKRREIKPESKKLFHIKRRIVPRKIVSVDIGINEKQERRGLRV